MDAPGFMKRPTLEGNERASEGEVRPLVHVDQAGVNLLNRLERIEQAGKLPESFNGAVEIKKINGAMLEMHDGLVCTVKNGANELAVEYQKRDGKIIYNSDGEPQVAKIVANVGNNISEIDAAALGASAGRVRVVQKGEGVGSIVITSEDGRTSSTLRTDFCRVEREKVSVAPPGVGASASAAEQERVTAIFRPNGARVDYTYGDPTKPLRMTQVTERYTTSMGTAVTQYSDRIGDTEKFVTHTEGLSDKTAPTWRTDVTAKSDGELAFRELNEKFFVGPRNQGDGNAFDLQTAREDFLRIAVQNKVFQGNENTTLQWMNRFEKRGDYFSDKGWLAPTELDLADSYTNLGRIFTDSVAGRARVVGADERRLLVESALKELAEPSRYINQGSIGTCSLNSLESNLANRRPQELTRWLREASTLGYVTSRGVNNKGQHIKIQMSENQLNYEPSWNRSYSNQIFQLASIAALGYRSNGRDYGGTTNQNLDYVSRLASGKNMGFLDNWTGRGARKSDIIDSLKKRGSVAYIVPGHCMAIDDYDPKTDRFYVNNWWGGQNDGWRSARSLSLR
jgi:hypothetical protein